MTRGKVTGRVAASRFQASVGIKKEPDDLARPPGFERAPPPSEGWSVLRRSVGMFGISRYILFLTDSIGSSGESTATGLHELCPPPVELRITPPRCWRRGRRGDRLR